MVDRARELGANAVINVRFTTSSVAQGASEILAYGTAVIIDRDQLLEFYSTDLAGNAPLAGASTANYTIDTKEPVVSSVVAGPASSTTGMAWPIVGR